jgi:hypothetical protein
MQAHAAGRRRMSRLFNYRRRHFDSHVVRHPSCRLAAGRMRKISRPDRRGNRLSRRLVGERELCDDRRLKALALTSNPGRGSNWFYGSGNPRLIHRNAKAPLERREAARGRALRRSPDRRLVECCCVAPKLYTPFAARVQRRLAGYTASYRLTRNHTTVPIEFQSTSAAAHMTKPPIQTTLRTIQRRRKPRSQLWLSVIDSLIRLSSLSSAWSNRCQRTCRVSRGVA